MPKARLLSWKTLRLSAIYLAVTAACGTGNCGGESMSPTIPDSIDVDPSSLALAVGASVRLTAVVQGCDGDVLSDSPAWSSSNPAVATVDHAGLVTGRGAGTATVTATAGSVSRNVAVRVEGDPGPEVTIVAPTDGASFVRGASIAFDGSAVDTEDGQLTGAALVWSSSRDGTIGTGTSFSRSDLSVGSHTVTLTATDSDANTGTSSISLSVVDDGGEGLTGLWSFRSDVQGTSTRDIVTATLMLEQTGSTLGGEARRVIKSSEFNDGNTVAYKGAMAQTGLTGSLAGTQVELRFSDTEGEQSYTGTYNAAMERLEGATWYAGRSTDPPPPTLAAPTSLTAGITPGPRVSLAWTDNSGNEQGFTAYRGCQASELSGLFDVGSGRQSAEDFGGPYGQDCTYAVVAFLRDTFVDSTGFDEFSDRVESSFSNQASLSIPTSPVNGIDPTGGRIGDVAVLTGDDFGSDGQILDVQVNGLPASIFAELLPPNQIRIRMPNGGYRGRMPVTVWKNGQVYGEAAWTQESPADFFEPNNNDHTTAPNIVAPGRWVGSFSSGDALDWRGINDTSSPRQLRFYLDWNSNKNLDLLISDGGGQNEICQNQGVGSQKPIMFECVVADDFTNVYALVVDVDAYANGDFELVSYLLEITEP